MGQDTAIFVAQVISVLIGACVLGTVVWLIAKKRWLGLQKRRWLDSFWRAVVLSAGFHLDYYVLLLVPHDILEASGWLVVSVFFHGVRVVSVFLLCWVLYRRNLRQTVVLGAVAVVLLLVTQCAMAIPLLILMLIMIGGI